MDNALEDTICHIMDFTLNEVTIIAFVLQINIFIKSQ